MLTQKFQGIPNNTVLKGWASYSDAQRAGRIWRLNSLGSSYFFIKIALKRRRLTDHLHKPICDSLERSHIKDVYELPRDHFKSTICSEGLPMWWALPVSKQDIEEFLELGYTDEFIRWLGECHDPDVRTCLISENITNSAKLGSKVRYHFESNDVFRALFPEIIPTTKETWTNYSLHVRRSNVGGGHGEGTFDFLGVGGALQSRHYNKVIEDDLVGRKAIESPSIMDKTIDYHRLLVGAFESEDREHENTELVVGNRWAYTDLNSHIREHEPWFRFSTHSALGGCCVEHPADTPIFPEEFSFGKLLKIKDRQGSYNFSCQYLNNPCAPEDADFKEEWLGWFKTGVDLKGRTVFQFETQNGVVKKDLLMGHLRIAMVSDPAHGGNATSKRCRHAIVVVGQTDTNEFLLLDCWAEACSYDKYIAKLFEMMATWRLHRVGLETVAAQKYLAYHLQYRASVTGQTIKIDELKGEVEAPDGGLTRNKEWRIRNVLSPIFERGAFYSQRRFQDFLGEYSTFPKGRYVDILDSLAYVPQLMKHAISSQQQSWMLLNNQQRAHQVNTPYSM